MKLMPKEMMATSAALHFRHAVVDFQEQARSQGKRGGLEFPNSSKRLLSLGSYINAQAYEVPLCTVR